MHEFDLSSAIVQTVNKHAAGRKVTHITLRVGRLRQVVKDTLLFYLAIVGKDTPCEGATLEIIDVPAVLRCKTLQERVGDRDPRIHLRHLRTRRCRGRDGRRVHGRVDRGRRRGGGGMHRTKVRVVEDALDANNTIAGANASDFERSNVTVVNLMSAPGAGKTTLLERSLEGIAEEGLRVGVLEGDVQGSFDADRLSVLHIPVVQLNTDNGFGGECHLDANMVRSALPAVPLDDIDVLIVENVGNLVCPAEFRIGEDSRIMVCSVTEGEDKPLKYPLMFRACELVVINKVDLLQYLDFDVDRLEANIKQVNHDATVMRVSAKTGEGVDEFRAWLKALPARIAAEEAARHDHDHEHGDHDHSHGDRPRSPRPRRAQPATA